MAEGDGEEEAERKDKKGPRPFACHNTEETWKEA